MKSEGHADSYSSLDIKFIRGHNPDLVILGENGEEVERIDLSPFKLDEIHGLLRDKGIERTEL